MRTRRKQPASDPAQDRVLIVDFGSQVTQLIARRVREAGVYSEIVPLRQGAKRRSGRSCPRPSSSPAARPSVHETGTPQVPQTIFNAGVPVLGICYGEQAMVAALGGQVEGGHAREFGRAELQIIDETPLFEGVLEGGRAGAGVDEPWRPRDAAPAWLPRRRHLDRRAVRGHRRRFAPPLRRPVPPRSGAYAERRGAACQFRPYHRRLRRRLDHGPFPRQRGRPHPRAGGRRAA